MKLFALVIAHNEDRTLPAVVDRLRSFSIPIVAVMDNPTPEVRWTLRHAIDAYEMPREKDKDHTYRWQKILDLVDWAIRRPRGYDWVLRVDADELWPDVRPDIELAEMNGKLVINFGIQNYRPTEDSLGPGVDFRSMCESAPENDPLFLKRKGMPYQRAWKLSGNWRIDCGGHIIKCAESEVHESDLVFHHYPAVDKNSLVKKAKRKYVDEERRKGWHWQYDKFLKDAVISNGAGAVSASVGMDAASELASPKPIRIYYHVAMMYAWKKLRDEQLAAMKKYGVLDSATLHECQVGKESDAIPGAEYGGGIDRFEYPTLERLWKDCRANPVGQVLYLHTKGVSRGHVHARRWRLYMEWAVLERWQECVRALQSGENDLAGTEWSEGSVLIRNLDDSRPAPYGFFAGNFWWANAAYIATLPDPALLRQQNRFWAEAWVGCGANQPRVWNQHDSRLVFGGKRGWQVLGWRRFHYAGV